MAADRPKRPAGCVDLEWGDSLSLARTGRAGVVCHGDTAIDPGARILGPGEAGPRAYPAAPARR
jgi:hypothetical protein